MNSDIDKLEETLRQLRDAKLLQSSPRGLTTKPKVILGELRLGAAKVNPWYNDKPVTRDFGLKLRVMYD